MFCLVCCINQHQNIMKCHEASVKNHHVCSVVEYPQLSNVINIYQTKNMVGRSPRLCQVVVSTEFQNGRPWWKPELWALAPRPGIQTQNGIDLFKMMGTCWENVARFAKARCKYDDKATHVTAMNACVFQARESLSQDRIQLRRFALLRTKKNTIWKALAWWQSSIG